ncbi:hypothetical protein Q3G72_018080 [Acer saccharum]|nr:hypothetical protein Q3G72_018080 [Acer saccharum]
MVRLSCCVLVLCFAALLFGSPERTLILSGSIHYPRSTPEMWIDLIKKAKEGGLNAIETYVFWDAHEPEALQYDFSGNLDLVRFIKTIQNEGLYAITICWCRVELWHEMKNFTTFIVNMMKHGNLFASQGGPIILAQINTCNDFYCDGWQPNNENSPKMWTENWSGWFQDWGDPRPHRTVKDLAFAVGRFFQYSGSLMNYYMYHGGTNFGHTSGGPYITTSYDYDAPLDEYGNLQQPKWGHLRNLHLILLSVQKTLFYGYKRDIDYGNMMSATVYNYEGKCVAFLGNANELEDFTINFQDNNYTVPRWSVTVLPDCFTEAYNTAKINSQTAIMVNKPNQVDDGSEPYKLLWVWRRETIEDIKKNGLVSDSVITTNKLLDHLSVTNDTSDYL